MSGPHIQTDSITALSRATFQLYETATADERARARTHHENAVAICRLHWLGLASPKEKARSYLLALHTFLWEAACKRFLG